jgi:hypothetical protein
VATASCKRNSCRRRSVSFRLPDWVVPYPLPAALFAIPFTPLPAIPAGAAFVGLSSALMALAITQDGQYWRLWAFASFPFFHNVACTQWGPLLVSAAFYPHLLPFTFAKPHIGIAAAVFKKPTKQGIILSGLLVAVSFLVDPAWPVKWLNSLSSYGGTIPILYPLGFILLLALSRWKKPGAHLILLSALLPKRDIYDFLLLWCLPNNKIAMLLASILSWAAIPILVYTPSAVLLFYLVPMIVLLFPKYLQPVNSRDRKIINDEPAQI